MVSLREQGTKWTDPLGSAALHYAPAELLVTGPSMKIYVGAKRN